MDTKNLAAGANDDRIRNSFRLGCTYAGIVVALLVVTSAFHLSGWKAALLAGADWRIVAAVPVVLAAACFGYAYLGAAIGAKRANAAVIVAMLVTLMGGLWWLTRYMDVRRS